MRAIVGSEDKLRISAHAGFMCRDGTDDFVYISTTERRSVGNDNRLVVSGLQSMRQIIAYQRSFAPPIASCAHSD